MDEKKSAPVRATRCVSCGAEVPIFSRASVQVVCPYCRSTLVRNRLQWTDIGKMASLADDLSPLHLGAKGECVGTAFTVIGRLQLQNDDVVWNEWLVKLTNNRTAWLSEGSGLFYWTSESDSQEALPPFKQLRLDAQVRIEGRLYSISNIEAARCVATEGEISFAINPQDELPLVDLMGENNTFATIDYSENPPRLYTGFVIAENGLRLASTNSPSLKQVASEELRCASCGNAVTRLNPASKLIVCAHCGCANELKAGRLLIAFNRAQEKWKLQLPLGSKGKFNGQLYEVIGFLARSGGGGRWEEYLLYNPSYGTRWLVCSRGHWSLMQACGKPSYKGSSPVNQGRLYKHHSSYQAKIDAVLGEFYWEVRRGETAYCSDYVCPPYLYSSETSKNEVTWSHGVYLQRYEIASAFSIQPNRSQGVGINEPSPSVMEFVASFLATFFIALLISAFIHYNQAQQVSIGNLLLTHRNGAATFTSEPFHLKTTTGLLQIHSRTNLRNDWADVEYRLVNQDTGETRWVNREISYYYGYDSDGSWSEGDSEDSAYLSKVSAGNYVLEVDADTNISNDADVVINLDATYGQGSNKNMVLLFCVLLSGPLIAIARKYFFEKRRWEDSDHPWEH